MSESIALSQVKIRSIKIFEVAFQKYTKELETQKVAHIPVFERAKNNESIVLGQIRTPKAVFGRLMFVANDKKLNEKPRITEDGTIENGFAMLQGDVDYVNGKFKIQNPIEHERLDTYYGAEAVQSILAKKGFQRTEYTVDQECDVAFEVSREVEEVLAEAGSF